MIVEKSILLNQALNNLLEFTSIFFVILSWFVGIYMFRTQQAPNIWKKATLTFAFKKELLFHILI